MSAIETVKISVGASGRCSSLRCVRSHVHHGELQGREVNPGPRNLHSRIFSTVSHRSGPIMKHINSALMATCLVGRRVLHLTLVCHSKTVCPRLVRE